MSKPLLDTRFNQYDLGVLVEDITRIGGDLLLCFDSALKAPGTSGVVRTRLIIKLALDSWIESNKPSEEVK